jgi:hypothetical protein
MRINEIRHRARKADQKVESRLEIAADRRKQSGMARSVGRNYRMTRSVPHPVIPAQAGIQYSTPFLGSRLRGNDGYFDRLVLKKTRMVHENLRGNISA